MHNPNVRCKQCDKQFTRLEWMTNKTCENPNCNCPEVKKAINEATNVIEKVMRSTQIEVSENTVPDGWDDTAPDGTQLQVSCPLVQVTDVTPIRRQ